MLCSVCNDLFQGHNTPWYHYKEGGRLIPAYHHHSSPAKLAKAAHIGCHICSIIWRKLASDEKTVLLNTWGNAYLYRDSQALQRIWGISLAYYAWSPIWWSAEDFGIRFQFGDAPFWKKITFRLLPVTKDCIANDQNPEAQFMDELVASPTSPTFSPEPMRRSEDDHHLHTHTMWSRRTQRLVQSWHKECSETHEECRNRDGGHVDDVRQRHEFQPTRILDLDDNKIRLDIEPPRRVGERYASLTHRWSLKPETMPRLNPEILREWCENINPAILTPTFRDAVDVARKLNIRYLWIDSLCIQQTGHGWEEDWMREAAVMGEVYRHAFLNIQAGRDTDALEMGLFRAPIDRDIDPFMVEVSRQIVKPRPYDRPSPSPISINDSFSMVEEDFARDELLGNPINRRGWVLQERLLSHRITHFGAHQLFWECRQLLACETFPDGLPKTIPKTMARAATQVIRNPTFDPKAIVRTIKRRMTANLHSDPAISIDLLSPVAGAKPTTKTPIDPRLPVPSFPSLTIHGDLFAWFYLAELYSACSLTRDTDKLVAISGLAQIFGSPTFHDRAADVVAYLRNLALPRSGGAVTDLHLDLDFRCNNGNGAEPEPATKDNPFRGRALRHLHKPSQHLISRHAHIGTRPTGDYLAGLWHYELIPCLLWHVANGRQHSGSPSSRIVAHELTGRAPSWSWASVNGLVHASIYQNWTAGIDGTLLAEVSGAETSKTFSNNPWGGVAEGKILLAARVIHQDDVKWPSADELEDLKDVKVRAHMSEVHASMTRRIKMNSASVARQRILKADVLAFVDDMKEFAGAIRQASFSIRFEVALVPLIGLQRRRADWSRVEGYVDEVFEWHGLVVGLSRKGHSKKGSPTGSQVDLSHTLTGPSAAAGMGAMLSAPTTPLLGKDKKKRQIGEDVEWLAERLGYFRTRDTDVFKYVLERRHEIEIMIT